MRSRHAAALALLGWYLMVPLPPEKTPSTSWGDYFADLFRRTNSFSDWRIVESFDSAIDCEKVRVRDFTSDEARKARAILGAR
jgi:spermidine/putrescine-binding protein